MKPPSIGLLVNRVRSGIRRDLRSRPGQAIAIGFLFAFTIPWFAGAYTLDVATQALIFILVVTSWNFVAGYFGILTFAHAALFGIGGYAAAILAAEFGVPTILTVFFAGGVVAVFSLPIAISLLHLRGAYVAMITIAYAEIIFLAAVIFRGITGGPTGYTGIPMMFGGDRVLLFYFVLVLVALLVALQYVLAVNRFGLVGRAIRESEEAAQMLGNNTRRYKVLCFVFGSSLAGVAGGLQAYNILIISPPMLELLRMIEFMAMGIVGGLRTLSGGIIGTIIVFGLAEWLRGIGEGARLLVWGFLLIIAIMYFPNGIVGGQSHLEELRDRIVDTVRVRLQGQADEQP